VVEQQLTRRRLVVKVAEVTVMFWVIKALTTAFGESASDYMVHAMAPVVAVLLGFVAFAAALGAHLASDRYRTVRYWLAVAMVGVFGTMAADVLHVGFGVPYAVSAAFFLVVLAVVFALWYRVEGTLSIHSIHTRRRELFYWSAVIATFALGTAVGDWTATSLHLGYLTSGVLFAAAILVPAAGVFFAGLNPVAGFWIAYVLTRPVGASFADWLGKGRGGPEFGAGPVALVLGALIVLAVGFAAWRGIDAPRESTAVD
jgi:uncharacterized membrane-anchored protein